MTVGQPEAPVVDVAPQVQIPQFVTEQLRSRGLDSTELVFDDDVSRVLAERRSAEENAGRVKTIEDAVAKAGVVNAREKLSDLNTRNPDTPKKASEVIGEARQVTSRMEYIAKALNQLPSDAQGITRLLSSPPRSQEEVSLYQLANGLVDRYGQAHPGEAADVIIERLSQDLQNMKQPVENALRQLRDIEGRDVQDKSLNELKDIIREIKDQITAIQNNEILGFKFLSSDVNNRATQDLDKIVFETYTISSPDWYDAQNPKNMENAIIEAEKFAGGDYAKAYKNRITGEERNGGKYALYIEFEDGSIQVQLENVNEYIIYRIAEHMAFQDPDDPIEVLNLRLFETPFRSVTLYEFLIHDASKYAQTRTAEGGKPSDLYGDFLMYWALQASSTGHNYNSGIQARNTSADEEMWADNYKKFLRSNKLASSKRLPRELRKLSREDIRAQIEKTGRLEYGKWKEFDGHLGQALSDYATMERYIFELSDNGWNITAHLDAMDDEDRFDRDNARTINEIKKELGRLSGLMQNPKPTVLTNLYVQDRSRRDPNATKRATFQDLVDELERLEDIRARIQNGEEVFDNGQWVRRKRPNGKGTYGQNFFFKTVHGGEITREGRKKEITKFLLDLTDRYMNLELTHDTSTDVKQVMDKLNRSGTHFMDFLQGRGFPIQISDTESITESDRQIIVAHLLVKGGFDSNGNPNLTVERIRQLAAGDIGDFATMLFTLDGNQYKKADLNIFTKYGGNAKEPIKGVVTDAITAAVTEKYREATEDEKRQFANLPQDRNTWTPEQIILYERVTRGLTPKEIEYVYEAGKEIAEWSMRKAQNDTGVTGNEFPVRIAHPAQYFLNNLTKLNVGDKETISVIRNTQDMMNGVPISVYVTDNRTKDSWREVMWLGEYMERGLYQHREQRTAPEFGEQSLSVFYTRRVEAAIKMYKDQRDAKSDTYNIGRYLVGYVLGEAEYSKQGLQEYVAKRNILADFLFTSKYPLPYKRNIREWVNEGGKVVTKTLQTEKYLLGNNVFLMEKVAMANPDIRRKIENGDWTRGDLLETMTELALVGSTLKERTYYYLPKEEKERYESGVESPIGITGLKEAFNTMANSFIGRFGAEEMEITLPDGSKRLDIVWKEGNRFTEEMAEQMFAVLSGVSIDDIQWHDVKETLKSAGGGILMALLGALFGEMFKAFQGSLK
jgi:hypothetical protein